MNAGRNSLDQYSRPVTVKYHLLGTMLLNELQKEHERVEDLSARVAALEQRE